MHWKQNLFMNQKILLTKRILKPEAQKASNFNIPVSKQLIQILQKI